MQHAKLFIDGSHFFGIITVVDGEEDTVIVVDVVAAEEGALSVESDMKRLNGDVVITSTQQSRVVSPASQLSVPHTRFPAQWLSRSQSPSPTPQGEDSVQQEKLVLDGSHVPVIVVGASVCIVEVKIFGNVTETTWIVGSTVTAVALVTLVVPRVFAVTV